MPYLRQKKKEAKTAAERAGIEIAIRLIIALPCERIEEGVLCRDCGWYDAQGKRCMHNNGLRGRLKPEMYCAYGSKGEQNWFAQDNEFAGLFGEEDDDGD